MNYNYNYVSLGLNCAPSEGLRALNLRKYSLPFDWIISSPEKIVKCISEDFKNFHKNLTLDCNNTQIIDYYGFRFLHDYPTTNDLENLNKIKDDDGYEFIEHTIIQNWSDYSQLVFEKYKRRTDRFIDIIKKETRLIIVYRGAYQDVKLFKDMFKFKFNKTNIKYVIAAGYEEVHKDAICINTEKNGIWNDSQIWEYGINEVKKYE